MITFTQMKQQAADNCGLYSDAPEMTKIARDINTGVKLFQNAARRYWTRNEKKTSFTKDQQYYQFSSDMLRITTAKALRNGKYYPLEQVKSEDEWNRLNITPTTQLGSPMFFYIKGADEIGVYPIPSETVTDGLIVSFEPRMVDMSITDVIPTVNVTENSYIITASTGAPFTAKMTNGCWFSVTDGSDGNWYKVTKFVDSAHIWIDNNYQGATSTGVAAIIGQCPPFPEEYHDAPVYYACHQFFLLRKDLESASMYKQLFDGLFNQYKAVYGNKTTGGVFNPRPKSSNKVIDPFAGYLMK
jgi:hypothetical protein